MPKINKIKLSGTSYDIQDSNASKTVTLTQAQYDALQTKDPNTFYIISDGETFDPSEKVDTSAFTAYSASVETALSGKAAQSDLNTLSGTVTGHTADTTIHVTTAQTAAWNAKSDFSGSYNDLSNKLSAGTNITIVDNVISAEGGGKAVSAGRGISVTTGETADTVSFNLPISAGTGTSGTYIAIGVNAYAQEGYNSFLTNAGGISIGSGSSANRNSIIIGNGAADDKDRGHGISIGTGAKSKYGSISIGEFSESSGTSYEEESSIAIGYRTTAKNVIKALAIGTDVRTTGTTKTNINNQLTIDTSNQVYIYNKDNTEMICLQDQLGGGGGITSGEVQSMIDESISGKTDESAFTAHTADTTIHVTSSDKTTWSGKQEHLVSGTNIKTINNESILGSGNITIQGGGGKAISAGTNISVTTGETADTINCTLNAKNGTGSGSIIFGNTANVSNQQFSVAFGSGTQAKGIASIAEGESTQTTAWYCHSSGYKTLASGKWSNAEGYQTTASTQYSHTEGIGTKVTNNGEHSQGMYNTSSSDGTTSGNTLFSVGNGTSNSARHNAFEIRQNGDIYCSDGTNDVKLQDTITATVSNTTALGGLKLVKLTQAQYDALATKDSNTLYIING